MYLTVFSCFNRSFLRVRSVDQEICSLVLTSKILADGVKLHFASALCEKDFVVIRNAEHSSQGVSSVVSDILELFRAVLHFHDAHATVSPIEHFVLGLLQNFRRHRTGTGVEVVHFLTMEVDQLMLGLESWCGPHYCGKRR